MLTETRSSTRAPKPRRRLAIAAVLAAFAILTTSAVAYWSRDSWSDEAMSTSAFPGLPGGNWDSTESADGWGDTSSSSSTTDPGTTAGTTSAHPSTTGVVEPASQTTRVPTSKAPAPAPTSTVTSTTAPAPTSTSAPSPSATHENPKPKPTPTKKPTPTSSPTSSPDAGCTLLIIC